MAGNANGGDSTVAALRDAIATLINFAENQFGASIVHQWLTTPRSEAGQLGKGIAPKFSRDAFHAICRVVDTQHGQHTAERWAVDGAAAADQPRACPGVISSARSSRKPSPVRRSESADASRHARSQNNSPALLNAREFHQLWKQKVHAASRPLSSLSIQVRIRYEAIAELTMTLKAGLPKVKAHALGVGDVFYAATGKLVPLLLYQLGCGDRVMLSHCIILLGLLVDALGPLFQEFAPRTIERCLTVVETQEMVSVHDDVFAVLGAVVHTVRTPLVIASLLSFLKDRKAGTTRARDFCVSSIATLLGHFVRSEILNVRYMFDDQLYPGTFSVPLRVASSNDNAPEAIAFLRHEIAARHGTEPSNIDLLDAMGAAELDDGTDDALRPPQHPLAGAGAAFRSRDATPALSGTAAEQSASKRAERGNRSDEAHDNKVVANLDQLLRLAATNDEQGDNSTTETLERTARPSDEAHQSRQHHTDTQAIFDALWRYCVLPSFSVTAVVTSWRAALLASVYLFFPLEFENALEVADTVTARDIARALTTPPQPFNFIVTTSRLWRHIDGPEPATQRPPLVLIDGGAGVDVPLEHRRSRRRAMPSAATMRVSIETPRRAASPRSTSGVSASGLSQPSLARARHSTSSATTMLIFPNGAGRNSVAGGSVRGSGASVAPSVGATTLLGTKRRPTTATPSVVSSRR